MNRRAHELLTRYAQTRSEDAFATVVREFLPLVYGAALRRVAGDAHLAQDVTQLVFTALARNAESLARHPALAGWLFTTTRFLADKAMRTERRRREREMNADTSDSSAGAAQADPALHALLDEFMMELRELDREVLLLRFHRGLRFAEIASRLELSDNAVQKRTERALGLLREKLRRRGITSTAAAVALALEKSAAGAIPAGLESATVAAAVTGGAVATGAGVLSTLMIVTKAQVGVAATLVVALSGATVWQYQRTAAVERTLAAERATATKTIASLRAELRQGRNPQSAAAHAPSRQIGAETGHTTPANTAAATTWKTAQERVDEANRRSSALQREGRYQEALDELLACYRDLRPKHSVQMQFVMFAIQGLGEKFPGATAALGVLRDAALQEFLADRTSRAAGTEFALLNERLGEGARTVALYDSLPPDSPLRQAFGMIAHHSFVDAQRYRDALVGKSFGGMLRELEQWGGVNGGSPRPTGTSARQLIIESTATDIEVLVGAGMTAEARTLTERLLAVDNTDATRAIIQKHVDRAKQVIASR